MSCVLVVLMVAVADFAGACAETMVEQERESIVMIENNAINFFICLKPVVVSIFIKAYIALIVKSFSSVNKVAELPP